jgi:hypothetical protein
MMARLFHKAERFCLAVSKRVVSNSVCGRGPLLEDYALHYLAEAYHEFRDHRKSLKLFVPSKEVPVTLLRKSLAG